ncbi:hypothetical protein QE152_g32198 [Popillia japonica]|uniref:Uncharacterized protein n=1 Tax=Popillia japonica TaxID=7064 RepID=A0AAW1IZI9_POPJA
MPPTIATLPKKNLLSNLSRPVNINQPYECVSCSPRGLGDDSERRRHYRTVKQRELCGRCVSSVHVKKGNWRRRSEYRHKYTPVESLLKAAIAY